MTKKNEFAGLEALLKKQPALPRQLREQTLKRMGLRPQGLPAWAWLLPTASLAAALFVLRPVEKAPLLVDPAPSAVLAKAKPAAKAEPVLAQAEAKSETAPVSVGQANPKAVETQALSGEGNRGPESVKAPTATAYKLSVKQNRLRMAHNERMQIDLLGAEPGHVRIEVFSQSGRSVKVLADFQANGQAHAEWDGRMDDGLEAPSGAYLILVQSPGKTEKLKAIVIR